MKVRVTVMTENDKTLDLEKASMETYEIQTKLAWQLIFNGLCGEGERAQVEKVEFVEV